MTIKMLQLVILGKRMLQMLWGMEHWPNHSLHHWYETVENLVRLVGL